MGSAMRQQFFGLQMLTLAQNHEQGGHLAEMLVRNADDGAIEQRRKSVSHLLDFSGRNILAAADDQFLQAAGDGDKAIGIALGQIASVVPAGAQSALRL